MYPDEQEVNNLKLEVGLLKKDNEVVMNITNKLSESIDKIQEMNSNLLRMISLHDQKHDNHIRTETELKEDIKDLHSRITTVNRELLDKIDEVEKHLANKLDLLRGELKQREDNDTENRKKNEGVGAMQEIEKYKFAIIAIAITLGWIIGNIDLAHLGKFFK
jgi:chromosome segregation ATPase